jgi:hypothetical protein
MIKKAIVSGFLLLMFATTALAGPGWGWRRGPGFSAQDCAEIQVALDRSDYAAWKSVMDRSKTGAWRVRQVVNEKNFPRFAEAHRLYVEAYRLHASGKVAEANAKVAEAEAIRAELGLGPRSGWGCYLGGAPGQ